MTTSLMFGRCDAVETPEIATLLALCRVMHLRYEIVRDGQFWSVTLSTYLGSPDDFYSYRAPYSRASFSTICIRDEADIPFRIMTAILSHYESLRDSCGHWRRIASTHPEYRDWPQFKRVESAP